MPSALKPHLPVILFIGVITLIRLAVAPTFGLGVDEAHYVLYGRYLDWSYFDHPPMVGWLHAFFSLLLGDNLFAARIGAVLIGVLTSLFAYRFILDLTADRTSSLIAVMALNAAFIFNALFLMMMPDTLLFALLFPVIWAVLRIERENKMRDWIVLGLLLGLAGLSKYTAVLFLAPILIYVVIRRRFDLLITPKILPAVVVALVVIAPVIFWNIQHDWISFTYQSDHVVGSPSIDWVGFGRSLAAQFGGYSPLLFPIAFYGLYRALRSRNDALFLAGLFAAVIFAFFTYASLYKTALPHWTAPFYLLTIPIGTAFLLEAGQKWRRTVYGATGVTLAITLLLYSELAFKWIPTPPYQSPLRDIYGFDTVMAKANTALEAHPGAALAVPHWNLASRALYYNSPYDSDLFLIDTRTDQFDFWEGRAPLGRDLLFISTKAFKLPGKNRLECDTLLPGQSFDIELNETPVNRITLTWCLGYRALNPR